VNVVLNLQLPKIFLGWLDYKLFIGLWKFHIDLLLHKLGTVRYDVRKLSHVLGRNAIKSNYLACFHLLIKYGVIFWGNSNNANKVFLFQKRVIRIIWE
jgi:hypothetical protein